MNLEQVIVLGVIAMTFGLFAWGKWRYDVVAVIALFSLVVGDVVLEKILRRGDSKLIDPDTALVGFGHGAGITGGAVRGSHAGHGFVGPVFDTGCPLGRLRLTQGYSAVWFQRPHLPSYLTSDQP